MKRYCIKSCHLSGVSSVPASKSQSIRALLFASLADGTSIVENVLNSPDIIAMAKACQQLGAEIHQHGDTFTIKGVSGQPKTPDDVIDAGNSGQVLRFIACLAGLQNQVIVITGDHSIRHNRPVQPLLEALPKLGLRCEAMRGDGYAPLIIKGPFKENSTTLTGEDSQPVSGLLMALAFRKGTTTITVRNPGEKPWIDLTLSWLDRLHIPYQNLHYQHYRVTGRNPIPSFHYCVPGDLSALAYLLVAAIITHSEITVCNVDMNEPQGDKLIIEVLTRMGANIGINESERIVTVFKTKELHGIDIDVNKLIDCVTIIAVLGCFATGKTKISNAHIARMKESDRIASICQELKKMGATIEELPDGLIVQQSTLRATTLESHHDHRIAMSLAVAAFAIQGESIIKDIKCVQKSFPNFHGVMQSLGADIVINED